MKSELGTQLDEKGEWHSSIVHHTQNWKVYVLSLTLGSNFGSKLLETFR